MAGVVGAICGAFQGVDALGNDWVAKVTASLTGQEELASRLACVTREKANAARQVVVLVDRLQNG